MRVVTVLRASILAGVLLGIIVPAWAQTGTAIKDPEMSRYMDRVSAAFDDAQTKATNATNIYALSPALKAVNDAWQQVYGRYYTWVTTDANWQRDFDAIQSTLTAAVNALTPGNDLPQARTQLNAAASTFAALRSRNGIPDLAGSIQRADAALKALSATVVSFNGKTLSGADITTLQTSYQAALAAWQSMVQALLDTNTLGLSEGQLDGFRQIVGLQNVALDAFNNVLKDPNTAALLAKFQEVRARFDELVNQLTPYLGTAEAPAGTQTSSAKSFGQRTDEKTGHRRFRLLR